jgi:uncharacterized protein
MPRDYENQSPTAFQRLPENTRAEHWIKDLLHRGNIARIASRFDLQPFINTSTFFYDEANQRIIFHSNIAGRIRANIEAHPEVCVEVSEFGKLLPSNIALEFSLQYRSVLVFGKAYLIEDEREKKKVLHQLIDTLATCKLTKITAPQPTKNSSVHLCMKSKSNLGAEKKTGKI